MAFWGIEVRPGKPYKHLYDNDRGRLRVSQATLGDGKGEKKSILQCNVGNKSPILLCSLIPNVSETLHLELEFQEDEEVVFSVLGQRSVHLCGYYLGSTIVAGGDETDSYGEDIGDEDSDSYGSYDSEEDEYESDFIDDGDVEMFSPSLSPQRKSCVVIEEIDDDELNNENTNHRRLKKKHQVSDTDDGEDNAQHQLVVKSNRSTVLESEDEDGFPISFSLKKKSAAKNVEENAKTDDKIIDDRKRKIDAINDPESAREICQPFEIDAENKGISKKKKKVKDKKPHEIGSKSSDGEALSGEQQKDENDTVAGENKFSAEQKKNDDDNVAGEPKIDTEEKDLAIEAQNDGKLKKKKKDKAKKGKTSETSTTDFSAERTEGTKGKPSEATGTDGMDQDHPAGPDEPSNDKDSTSRKQKKKKKKKRVKDDIAHEEDDVQVENGSTMQISSEDVGKTNENIAESHNEKASENNADPTANVTQQEAKKKKKKNKNQDKDLNANQELSNPEEVENKAESKARTFANGLTIEELAMGKPDGKRASPGCKVSVNYIGKLKNGKIFDSNVGQRPFKFRLGIGQVIKGWDVGVNGMRVGDKRRLTIPPSMGYGERAVGKIPGNSWLVFDVELVSVQ